MDFIITGTQVYGPTSNDSDLDIVVKQEDAVKICEFLANHNIEEYRAEGQEKYGELGGFYFNLATIKINIIIAFDDDDFNLWRERTNKMKELPEIPDRVLRLSAFNSHMPIDQLKRCVYGILNETLTEE